VALALVEMVRNVCVDADKVFEADFTLADSDDAGLDTSDFCEALEAVAIMLLLFTEGEVVEAAGIAVVKSGRLVSDASCRL
jgi:hypothetical protein